MMRRTLLSSVSALAMGGAAMAADMPYGRAYAPMAPIMPIFTWTGFYVGANAGLAWGDGNTNSFFLPAGTFPGSTAGTVTFLGNGNNNTGFTGGAEIGYNYQAGAWVFGVAADIQWAGLGTNHNSVAACSSAPTCIPAGFTFTNFNNGVDWFGTVRGRLGYAMDRSLLYFTGGFAYGGGNNNNSCGVVFGCGGDNTRGGWTLGGGWEYAFTNNWTAKIEGLWVNLDNGNRNTLLGFTAAGTPVFVPVGFVGGNTANTFGVVRVGINYKF